LTARALEAAGIATVVIGSALDILQRAGTPRIVFNDLPLGNPVGKPFDSTMQNESLSAALNLLYQAQSPGAVQQLPNQWSASEGWRDNFMAITPHNREQLLLLGEESRRQRLLNREQGLFRP